MEEDEMKTVVVYYHPYNKSFCHAILDQVINSSLKAGHEIDIIHLNVENFWPVMTSEDLQGFVKHQMVDPQSIEYAKRVKKADHLIMIFPIWWELMPAMIKGFIDKIIFPGTCYEYTQSGLGMRSLMPNVKVTIFSTMNTPKFIYQLIYGNALKNALVKGTFKKSGVRKVKWVSFHMVKGSSDKKRKDWLKKVERLVTKG